MCIIVCSWMYSEHETLLHVCDSILCVVCVWNSLAIWPFRPSASSASRSLTTMSTHMMFTRYTYTYSVNLTNPCGKLFVHIFSFLIVSVCVCVRVRMSVVRETSTTATTTATNATTLRSASTSKLRGGEGSQEGRETEVMSKARPSAYKS